jgi:cell division protein FtsW (lipid II flippase)/serine/threonine protein phosphatase PrpC
MSLRVAEHFEKSDTGRQRRANEDSFFVRAPLFVVADGMGGAQAGEVASRLAAETFSAGLPDDGTSEQRLEARVREANTRIHEVSQEDRALNGMGTTLTAAYLDGDELTLAHVGDSRAYLLRDGELSRLTRDHTLVEELVRRGELTAQEAAEHPQRSIITRALGPEPDIDIDLHTHRVHAGDVLLLCSDGLTGMIGEDEVQGLVAGATSLRDAGRALVDAANEAGGRDNITVVLFRLEEVGAGTANADRAGGIAFAGDRTRPQQRPGPANGPAARQQGASDRAAAASGEGAGCDGGCGDRGGRLGRGGLARLARGLLRRHGRRRDGDGVPRRAVGPAGRGSPVRVLVRLRRAGRRPECRTARSAARPPPALARRRAQPDLRAGARGTRQMSARNRELLGLIPASLLVTAGFAAVFIQQGSEQLSNLSLTYGAIFLGLCVAAHVFLRIALPYADPYLFPLVAVLASFGLVVIYRIDDTLARQQAQWFVAGLGLFVATIVFVRDYRKLEQYRYLIAAASLALLVLPRLPGIGAQVNGAYLGVRIPGVFVFQPTEFAKIGIVVFLASYLRDTRQLLVTGARRIAGITLPPLKHFGPLLVIWGIAMLLLIVIRDLGSSLMFFGAFLAVLYVATSRVSFVVVGLALFGIGAWYLGTHVPHVTDRVDVWLDPLNAHRYPGVGYQIANSLFAQADGGLLGRGFGEAFLVLPQGGPLLPAPQTDLIYAVIVNELGLVGAVAVLTTYLLVVQRGFKVALLARDSFSTLLAVGLSAVFALQVFVIVGGVTNVIPLTGVTLPFISYGGSSLLANFVLLALLLLVSDRARREAEGVR